MTGDMKYQKIMKYLVRMVCTQPLHIGSASGDKEEVLVHPTDSVPFIQASSLAGVLRQYYAQQHDEKQAEKLFGNETFLSPMKILWRALVRCGLATEFFTMRT